MVESSQSLKAVRESGAYRAGALTFRRLGERLRLVTKNKEADGDLVRVIETEILPRLMLVHRDDAGSDGSPDIEKLKVTDRILEDFVEAIVEEGTDAANETVLDLVASGVPLEDVFLDLVAPAARLMGEKWTSDEMSFVDVTIGLCRLHELLRNNSAGSDVRPAPPGAPRPSIVLGTIRGDQHVFGAQMAAEFFRRDGWRVACDTASEIGRLAQIVSEQKFDVIGLSLGNTIETSELEKDIEFLRNASVNKSIKVMLGGCLMTHSGEFVRPMGADLVSADASTAPRAARALLAIAAVSV
ncbi:MAG: cobalamin-dependent protein [Pseudomonadota bacterium]